MVDQRLVRFTAEDGYEKDFLVWESSYMKWKSNQKSTELEIFVPGKFQNEGILNG